MALIQCPECGAQVSDVASSCPECGYKLKNQTEIGSVNKNASNSNNSQSVDSILDAKPNNYFWKSALLLCGSIVCCMISSAVATTHYLVFPIVVSMLSMYVVIATAVILSLLGALVDRQWVLGSQEKSEHYSSLITKWHWVCYVVMMLMALMILVSLAY